MPLQKEPKDILSAQEFHERDEILRQRMSAVKRDENELQFELERLERERSLHIRELKRINNEDNSRYTFVVFNCSSRREKTHVIYEIN